MRFNFWSWLGLSANLITIAVSLAFLALMLLPCGLLLLRRLKTVRVRPPRERRPRRK